MCSFTFTTHGLPSFIFEIHVPESLKVSQGDRLLFYYDKKRILVGILNLRFLQCVWIFWTKYQRYKKLFFWILGDTKVLSWQFNMQLIQLFCRNTQIQIVRQLLKPGYICICLLFFCMQMISYREISKKLLLSISENCKGKLCGGIFKFFWNLQKQ